MNHLILSLCTFLIVFDACQSQVEGNKKLIKEPLASKIIGGPFENGDFMYIGMPDDIMSIDTSPGWGQNGQKLLITGTIYELDGKTPVPDVTLYYYHTDIDGLYNATEDLDKRVRRHGYIRGWVKSDANGRYSIYTVRPGAYPGNREPAHIHPSIKEPSIDKEYYIDAFVFDDDVLLTSEVRKNMTNRGGSGVLRIIQDADLQIAVHDVILGLNIPHHPHSTSSTLQSGRAIGEDVLSFTPYHAWGIDKGSKACPICKYGKHQGILYFVGRKPNWNNIRKWLHFFERESIKRDNQLKVYFIYGNDDDYNYEQQKLQLEKIGRELQLQKVALTLVPSLLDKKSHIVHNNVNPDVSNTILIYRQSNIIDKYIDLIPTDTHEQMIKTSLDRAKAALRSY